MVLRSVVWCVVYVRGCRWWCGWLDVCVRVLMIVLWLGVDVCWRVMLCVLHVYVVVYVGATPCGQCVCDVCVVALCDGLLIGVGLVV